MMLELYLIMKKVVIFNGVLVKGGYLIIFDNIVNCEIVVVFFLFEIDNYVIRIYFVICRCCYRSWCLVFCYKYWFY